MKTFDLSFHYSLSCLAGKGVPNELAKQRCPAKLAEDLLPVDGVAADLYQQEVGSIWVHFWM